MSETVQRSFKPVYDIVHRSFSTNVWHGLMFLFGQCLTLLNTTDFVKVNVKLPNIETMVVKIRSREISLNTKVSSATYQTQDMTFNQICFKTSCRGFMTETHTLTKTFALKQQRCKALHFQYSVTITN
jgi:hypothetical protein